MDLAASGLLSEAHSTARRVVVRTTPSPGSASGQAGVGCVHSARKFSGLWSPAPPRARSFDHGDDRLRRRRRGCTGLGAALEARRPGIFALNLHAKLKTRAKKRPGDAAAPKARVVTHRSRRRLARQPPVSSQLFGSSKSSTKAMAPLHLASFAVELAVALWPVAALEGVCRGAWAAGRWQRAARQRRQALALATAWLASAWPVRAACRAAARATEAWANEAAWRVVLSFRATRYPSARRMVDGVVRSQWPFPLPEGRPARVSNLASGRVLTPLQAAVAAWPRARARWYLLRREPLVLPGGTLVSPDAAKPAAGPSGSDPCVSPLRRDAARRDPRVVFF